MAGQTINDRLLAAKHSLAGQGLAKSVCKATTEEMLGPKKKHLDYLVHCTNEPNVSIPQMANLLIERSQNTSWVVVFKSLITTHHLMCYGNERFTQYLASSNVSFQLSNFVDKTGVQSAVGARTGYDMSPFIRRYAKYLNEKALSYRAVAFDFCKVKRGKEEGTLRTMDAENLLKTLPILQNQLDALLEFDCTANDLTNGVINMCFMLLFRDLIRLFACYNDGIINLLEKYFELNKKQCREALDLYKKFLIRMDRVGEFLKVAENIGIDKGDIPDLTRAPNSLLDALEQHLASLEGNTPTAATNQKNLKSGVSALSNTSSAFGSAMDDNFKQAAVAEEEAAFNQYKANIGSPGLASTNPFLSEEPQAVKSEAILDLFGDDSALTAAPSGTAPAQNNAIDDLLSLGGNPFSDFSAPAPAVSNGMPDFFAQSIAQPTANQNLWDNGNAFQAPVQQQTVPPGQQPFNDLTGVFSTAEPSVFDPLGSAEPKQVPVVPHQPNLPPQRPPQPSKILTGDLESSLNSLVENLTMDSGSGKWNSPKNQPKTSTAMGWQPQQMATTNAASYRPMMGAQPQQMMPQQPVMQQPFMGGAPQYMAPYQQPQMMGSPKIGAGAPANQPQEQPAFDPFGALETLVRINLVTAEAIRLVVFVQSIVAHRKGRVEGQLHIIEKPAGFQNFFPTFECAARPLLDPKIHARVEISSISSNTVEVSCQANYQNILAPCKSSKFYCKHGKWIGVYPRCVEAHMCKAPPAIPYAVAINRNFETSYDSEGLPFFPINAQISYECLKGYVLDGSAVISCRPNGCWEPIEFWPTCIRAKAKANYFTELNNINAILISSATGAGVLGILLLACLVVACKKRKAFARAVSLQTSTSGTARHAPYVVNDHAVLLQHPERPALIAFADGVQNNQNSLPSYDEATRDRPTLIQVSRLQIQRPHWPNLAVCRSGRSRGSPNTDSGHHVARHGSFASHTPSMRSGGESMGSTETVTISEGSTNVTLDTASSHSALSQNPSCRGHCGSLASFDACSIANTEGIPLLEESEQEEIQGGTNDVENPLVSDNTSSKISTHSAPMMLN